MRKAKKLKKKKQKDLIGQEVEERVCEDREKREKNSH